MGNHHFKVPGSHPDASRKPETPGHFLKRYVYDISEVGLLVDPEVDYIQGTTLQPLFPHSMSYGNDAKNLTETRDSSEGTEV